MLMNIPLLSLLLRNYHAATQQRTLEIFTRMESLTMRAYLIERFEDTKEKTKRIRHQLNLAMIYPATVLTLTTMILIITVATLIHTSEAITSTWN